MNNYINKPLVSIVCTTFNHAEYIKNTLDGFIMQITKEKVTFKDIAQKGATTG